MQLEKEMVVEGDEVVVSSWKAECEHSGVAWWLWWR